MEITANAIQTVSSGSNVLFTDTLIGGGGAIIHTQGSGLVTLRGLAKCQCRARFKVFFNGNIAIPTGETPSQQISLAIAINGEPINSTWMAATPSNTDQYFNVSSAIYIEVPAGCCLTASVQNNGVTPINVANANLIVERVA